MYGNGGMAQRTERRIDMTQEDYENIKRSIAKRAELEHLYVNSEIERAIKSGLPPHLPIDPFYSAIFDYMAYGTDEARERVLSYLKN